MEYTLSQFRKANRFFRQARPVEASCTRCEAFRQGGLLEVAVPASRCRHDLEGRCIMCNYGSGWPIQSRQDLESQFDAHVSAMGPELETLILCTNGSFLDDQNVPSDVQASLLRHAQASAAPTIIIETHLDTLTQEKLELIRRHIPSKQIILEIGLESADPFVQKYCYLKEIPLNTLETAMEDAGKLDLMFQLNVILGAPFLTALEQADDAERAIRWALTHGALAALFPMNIKPYTLLRYAYRQGLYRPISHWAMPLLLERFSAEELERIDLAWYGNRQIKYHAPETVTVFPTDCPVCADALQGFYRTYVLTSDGAQRHALLEDILSAGARNCDCMRRERRAWRPDQESREDRVFRLHQALLADLRRDKIINEVQ